MKITCSIYKKCEALLPRETFRSNDSTALYHRELSLVKLKVMGKLDLYAATLPRDPDLSGFLLYHDRFDLRKRAIRFLLPDLPGCLHWLEWAGSIVAHVFIKSPSSSAPISIELPGISSSSGEAIGLTRSMPGKSGIGFVW